MKVVFVSNYFNHHQKPFCEEMFQRLGENFAFISTAVMREERRKLGYAQEDLPSYVNLAYENEQQLKHAMMLINEADAVIVGSAPEYMVKERIRAGKLVLRYSERLFKKKASFLRRAYHCIRFHIRECGSRNVYMLCASAYTAGDCASIGMYRNRTYKWGYFPALKEYDIDALLAKKKRNTLMWCGRFIDWKHPDDAILLAKKLKSHGYAFQLNFVGTGDMEEELQRLVEQYELTDCVQFLGAMPPDQVRIHMEEAGIFLFTSDRQEGWGAVLNESMNSGCAVVASHAIGSVPFLLQDEANGLIYPSGNVDAMFEKVRDLLKHPEEQEQLGRAAYKTVITEWNAEIVVNRMVLFINSLINGVRLPNLFENGPCSKAERIQDECFKEYLS